MNVKTIFTENLRELTRTKKNKRKEKILFFSSSATVGSRLSLPRFVGDRETYRETLTRLIIGLHILFIIV